MTLCRYPTETVERGLCLRQEGMTWKQIAAELGGTDQSWRMLVQRRMGSGDKPSEYKAGRMARVRGLDRGCIPFAALTCAGSWWLAGWNDKDIELKGNRYETDTRDQIVLSRR